MNEWPINIHENIYIYKEMVAQIEKRIVMCHSREWPIFVNCIISLISSTFSLNKVINVIWKKITKGYIMVDNIFRLKNFIGFET